MPPSGRSSQHPAEIEIILHEGLIYTLPPSVIQSVARPDDRSLARPHEAQLGPSSDRVASVNVV